MKKAIAQDSTGPCPKHVKKSENRKPEKRVATSPRLLAPLLKIITAYIYFRNIV